MNTCTMLIILICRPQDLLMVLVILVNIGSIVCMGITIAREPLSHPGNPDSRQSPYQHGTYYGWAIAAGTAVFISAGLPIYSWFTTFRLSKSSVFCLATCLGKRTAYAKTYS